ncbi:MAG: hypothetical protein KGZ54_06185 [Dethiobacter sp.]|jgi:hypothetical protein|nr:hypothetical protein [Dethiobacter sp.]MBS3989307.1 hypothetical protein [Dethiobacter sp.]
MKQRQLVRKRLAFFFYWWQTIIFCYPLHETNAVYRQLEKTEVFFADNALAETVWTYFIHHQLKKRSHLAALL